MSEQKTTSYMHDLNLWIDATVIGPIESACGSPDFEKVVETVKKAIRTKVLESYHNGQQAGPRGFPRGGSSSRQGRPARSSWTPLTVL